MKRMLMLFNLVLVLNNSYAINLPPPMASSGSSSGTTTGSTTGKVTGTSGGTFGVSGGSATTGGTTSGGGTTGGSGTTTGTSGGTFGVSGGSTTTGGATGGSSTTGSSSGGFILSPEHQMVLEGSVYPEYEYFMQCRNGETFRISETNPRIGSSTNLDICATRGGFKNWYLKSNPKQGQQKPLNE